MADHRLGERPVHARVPGADRGSDDTDHVNGPQRPGRGLESVEDRLLETRHERLALVEKAGDRGATFDDGVVRAEEPLGIEPTENRAALPVVGWIPICRRERGLPGCVGYGTRHHRVGDDRRAGELVDDGEVALRVPGSVEDGQAPVTEVDLCGRGDHAGHPPAVIVGAHPITELGAWIDLVEVTEELAVPIVDEPLDRVDERPVEQMTHGERLRREPACRGQASRVVDVGVRDDDVETSTSEPQAQVQESSPENQRRRCRRRPRIQTPPRRRDRRTGHRAARRADARRALPRS